MPSVKLISEPLKALKDKKNDLVSHRLIGIFIKDNVIVYQLQQQSGNVVLQKKTMPATAIEYDKNCKTLQQIQISDEAASQLIQLYDKVLSKFNQIQNQQYDIYLPKKYSLFRNNCQHFGERLYDLALSRQVKDYKFYDPKLNVTVDNIVSSLIHRVALL